MRLILFLVCLFAFLNEAQAGDKKVIYRKSQNVDFDGSAIDGVARTPDGAYLVQKRGVKFLPLYKVKKQFDENIKDSVKYLR